MLRVHEHAKLVDEKNIFIFEITCIQFLGIGLIWSGLFVLSLYAVLESDMDISNMTSLEKVMGLKQG